MTAGALDSAEADVAEAEARWTELLLSGDTPYLASVAFAEARRHGGLGWREPGVALWQDRARAEAVGRRWLALYDAAVNPTEFRDLLISLTRSTRRTP